MLSLPVELQLRIFELATHVPRLFEITPDINGIFLNDSRGVATILDILEDFHRSLLTRKSLALVSRTFNAVATPILYSCIHLTASSAEVMSSIDASKGHMVRHVIMDLPQRVGASTEVKVASFFDLLPNVQALTIRMAKFIPGGTPFLYPNGILARTMLLRPSDFDVFTSSLVHLECFTCFCSFPSVSYSENLVKFPPSLPHLTHVNIQNIPLAFPHNATPTHVLCPLNNHIPSLLSPALTHLSLTISSTAISFDVYSALRLHAPNLTSLAISGPLPDVTRFLASGPVPAIPRLTFVHIHPKIREVPTSTEVSHGQWIHSTMTMDADWRIAETQVWVDAIAAIPGRGEVGAVRVLGKFARSLWGTAGRGGLNVRELEQRGVVIVDGKGRALMDAVRTDVVSFDL